MKTTNYIKRMKPLLGTFVEVGILDSETKDIHQQNRYFEVAFKALQTIASQMSFHHEDSALSQLNKSPRRWVSLPKETLKVLALAKQLGEQSAELFNCTVGGHLVQNQKLPDHFPHRFNLSGSSMDIEIKQNQARLITPVLITLDGIAKGYAIDFALEKLQSLGVQSAWINAGGDIKVIGEIKLPIHRRKVSQTNSLEPLTELTNCALATSQISRDLSVTLPSQIVDTQGIEAQEGLISVATSQAWLADGLTKVLALLPENERQQMAHQFSAEYFCSKAS
ncbi:FAD:protein FMN transferase [Thiomicrorhabdus immobilis]|uniref:FAD:protein FMN transferase n=1 Tax=Thiomicrorhabdus immobilis TaxID=2791037 RepID=A0ABM7MDR6_9GAMM|nr:FAD:protein FMN transferase [Thiomicrorhabdus immobilis]BCN93477.1 FAD:protein FMN transferase [Thiomicrorhabdus immobilis]